MTSPKAIIAFSALAILLLASALGPSMSMPVDAQGHMGNCPFSLGATAICPMNFQQHIGYWQQFFSSTIPASTALMLLIFFAVVALGICSRNLINDISQKSQSVRFHKESNAHFKLFNPFILLFSDGILNSKLYAFSR